MSNLNLSTVELVSTLRAAPQNGSPSSQDYNDSWTEALADLASLADFINDTLLPMLNGLDDTILPNLNGTPNGLEGRFIFGDTTDTTPLFFDSLSNQSITLADSMRILQGINTNLQLSINTLTVTVTSLQTQLSSTNQNDIATALQNLSTSVQNLTSQVVGNTQAISNNLVTFETNGTLNTVQNILNLVAGTNISLSATGGIITIASTGSGSAIVTKTVSYATALTDFTVLMNSTGSTTVTLTTTGLAVGQRFRVKNINTGIVTVQGQTGNIDGSSTFILSTPNSAAEFQWDGTNWWIF